MFLLSSNEVNSILYQKEHLGILDVLWFLFCFII